MKASGFQVVKFVEFVEFLMMVCFECLMFNSLRMAKRRAIENGVPEPLATINVYRRGSV